MRNAQKKSEKPCNSLYIYTHTLCLQKRSTSDSLIKEESRKKFQNIRNNTNAIQGITLVALVITIIILLILASISMSLITNDENLFGNADTAATTYEVSEVEEAAKMIVLQKYMDNNGTGTATMEDIKTGLEAKGYTIQTDSLFINKNDTIII